MAHQIAASNRVRLLAFCESLAAAVELQYQSEPCCIEQRCSKPAAAPAVEQASAGAALPLCPFALQLQPSAGAGTDTGVAPAPITPRQGAQCSRLWTGCGAAQLLQNAAATSGNAAEPTAASVPAACGESGDTSAAALQASKPQQRQHEEPSAPQTPHKVAPLRPAATASCQAGFCQPARGPGEPVLAECGAGAVADIGCAADAPCTAAASAALPHPPTSASTAVAAATDAAECFDEAEVPALAAAAPATQASEPVDEAEALALAAVCVLAATALERAAVGQLPWPLYLIATRDCFTFELVASAKQACKLIIVRSLSQHLCHNAAHPIASEHTQAEQTAECCARAGDVWARPVHADRVFFQAGRASR